jgi:uncharacterized Zn-finger protein
MFRADPATGELVPVSEQLPEVPDGVVYKPCGDRRASVCPACAERYRRDTWQLIAAGLRGGKGVPVEVTGHPAVFLTLTAPSFGLVHTRRTASTGRVLPCRPRRKPAMCPHGIDLRCSRHHDQDESLLGLPLCLDCYDHEAQVVWNAHVGELWRRTVIGLRRRLVRVARDRGTTVRLSYAKVAEFSGAASSTFTRCCGSTASTPQTGSGSSRRSASSSSIWSTPSGSQRPGPVCDRVALGPRPELADRLGRAVRCAAAAAPRRP